MDAGTAEAWLITFTTELRAQLPSGDYIITHARGSRNILIRTIEALTSAMFSSCRSLVRL